LDYLNAPRIYTDMGSINIARRPGRRPLNQSGQGGYW